jgi:hypothetical protein
MAPAQRGLVRLHRTECGGRASRLVLRKLKRDRSFQSNVLAKGLSQVRDTLLRKLKALQSKCKCTADYFMQDPFLNLPGLRQPFPVPIRRRSTSLSNATEIEGNCPRIFEPAIFNSCHGPDSLRQVSGVHGSVNASRNKTHIKLWKFASPMLNSSDELLRIEHEEPLTESSQHS